MEDNLGRKNGMPSEAVKKDLQHTFPPGDHGGVLFGLALLDGVIAERLLAGYRGYD